MPEPEVLYESNHVPRARRFALSLAFGALLPISGAWWRWARDGRGTVTPAEIIAGAALALAMILTALRSRTVYRVELAEASLRIHRDPGVIERHALADLRVTSEPTSGGWSRNPAETLVVTAPDGRVARYRFPDDAHTPGIVDDITLAQRGGTPFADSPTETRNSPAP